MEQEDFIVKHWEYIQQSTNCRAIEIAELTGMWRDFEDYKQEIYLWIVRRAGKFDPARGMPTTFISMTVATAKKRILRRMLRAKNRMITNASQI